MPEASSNGRGGRSVGRTEGMGVWKPVATLCKPAFLVVAVVLFARVRLAPQGAPEFVLLALAGTAIVALLWTSREVLRRRGLLRPTLAATGTLWRLQLLFAVGWIWLVARSAETTGFATEHPSEGMPLGEYGPRFIPAALCLVGVLCWLVWFAWAGGLIALVTWMFTVDPDYGALHQVSSLLGIAWSLLATLWMLRIFAVTPSDRRYNATHRFRRMDRDLGG